MRGLGIAWRKEGAVRGGWEEEQRMGGEECEGLGPLSCSGKAAAAPGEMLLELIMALAAVPSPGGGCWQRKEITFTGIWNKCSSSGGNNSTHLPPQSPHVPASPPCPHSCVPPDPPTRQPAPQDHDALPPLVLLPSTLPGVSPSRFGKLAFLF